MAILKTLIVKGVARFLTDAYMSTIKSGIWNGSTIEVGYGGTGVTSAVGDLYTPVFLSPNGIAPCSVAIPHNTKDFVINGVTYSIFTTYTGTVPPLFAPTSLAGTGGYILATNSAKNGLEWVAKPAANVTTSAVVSGSASGTTLITAAQTDPYYNLIEGGSITRSIQFKHGDDLSISASTGGIITYSLPDRLKPSSTQTNLDDVPSNGFYFTNTGTLPEGISNGHFIATKSPSGYAFELLFKSSGTLTTNTNYDASDLFLREYNGGTSTWSNWVTILTSLNLRRFVSQSDTPVVLSAFNTTYTIATIGGVDIKIKTPINPNTWRNIYTGGTSRVGTGIDTKAINFATTGNLSVAYLAPGTSSGQSGSADYFTIRIDAAANAVGVAGYVAAPTATSSNRVWMTNADGAPAWRTVTAPSTVPTIGTSDTTIATIGGVVVKAKIGSYSASNHTHYYLVAGGDHRSDATAPSNYSNKFVFVGIKYNTTLGITEGGTYSYLVGLRGWPDNSGGGAHELAFSLSSGLFRRKSTSNTEWGDWIVIADSSNISSSNATIGTLLTTVANIAGIPIQAKIDAYLPLIGGTMSGAIRRYYGTDSDDPMVALTSNNKDVWLWRINYGSSDTVATGGVYGFGLKYIGTGTGTNNNLVLYADNSTNEDAIAAVTINLLGKITLATGNIVNDNITIPWNTETTIATITGVPIKIKIPANPNTWRNVRINSETSDKLGTATNTGPLIIKAGTNISVTWDSTAKAIVITNTGVRSVSINDNLLRVNTNGTNTDLTIPYATTSSVLNIEDLNTEADIVESGVRAYAGSGSNWTGNIDSMASAAILTFGQKSKGWLVWAEKDGTLGMYWRRGTSNSSAWGDPRLFLDNVNTSASVSSNTLTLTIGGSTTTFTPSFSDVKVTQNSVSTNANYNILLKYTNNNTNETNTVKYSGNLYYNPSTKLLYNNGAILATDFGYFGGAVRIFGAVSSSTLKELYGLPDSWATSDTNSTETFLKAWCNYGQTNYPGNAMLSKIAPNALGYIQAHSYNSGFITQSQIDGGGSYANAELGAPVHFNGHYFSHGGNETIFGYSYGNWYYYNNLHTGNSRVLGGGNTWGSSMTVVLGTSSATLTIPQLSSLVTQIFNSTKTLKVSEWTSMVAVNTYDAGTYVIQISSGTTLYASGIFSLCKNSDTVNDEILLHVSGTTTSWRPYARINGNYLQMSSTEAVGTSRSYTIKIFKLI